MKSLFFISLWLGTATIGTLFGMLLTLYITAQPEKHQEKPVYSISCVDGTLREKYSSGPWLEAHDKHGDAIACSMG